MFKVELLANKTFILRCHVLIFPFDDQVLLCHEIRTQRVKGVAFEIITNANLFLQGDNVIPMAHALFLTTTDEGVDGGLGETGRPITLRVDLQMKVSDIKVLIEFVLTVHVNDLTEDAHRATHLVSTLGSTLHSDTNNNLCPHLASDVGRIVILQATVDQHLIANPHRRKGGRNGHRSTHGLG